MTTVEIAGQAQQLALAAHWIIPAAVALGAVLAAIDHYFDPQR